MEKILILIANRFSKVFGTLIKILCYMFYPFFSKIRFTIPKHSEPILKSKNNSVIPKIIWQTNFTNKVTFPVYMNYLYNRVMSLGYEYRYVSTEEREKYMKRYLSDEGFHEFKKLTNGAAQADFWRIFVLYKEGGVYMDIDAHLVWPLSRIINRDDKELFILTKNKTYNNYFIASRPLNPVLKDTVNIIIDNIKNKRVDKGVYHLTGPNTLTSAIGSKNVNAKIYREVCIQGSFTNEHFQYIDKPKSKWTYMKQEELLKD